MQLLIIINGKFLELILIFKIPMGMRKDFFEDYGQIRHAPSRSFASPGVGPSSLEPSSVRSLPDGDTPVHLSARHNIPEDLNRDRYANCYQLQQHNIQSVAPTGNRIQTLRFPNPWPATVHTTLSGLLRCSQAIHCTRKLPHTDSDVAAPFGVRPGRLNTMAANNWNCKL
jgi:hypothetical protein